jgi:hypothetical protein
MNHRPGTVRAWTVVPLVLRPIESAEKADTVVYSILFADDEPHGEFGAKQKDP